jgi:tyrosine-protein kinase Etk/Wzc
MKTDDLATLMLSDQGTQKGRFELGHYLDIAYDNRKLIAAFTLVATFIGAAYALLAQPVYESDILIQIETNPNSPNNLLSGVSSMFDVKSDAEDEMSIIGSRLVVSSVVDSMKLYIRVSPKYFPVIGRWIASYGDKSSRPGLFGHGGFVWGRAQAAVENFEVPGILYGKKFELTALPDAKYRLRSSAAGVDVVGRIGIPLAVNTPDGSIDLLVSGISAPAGTSFILARESRLETIERLRQDLRLKQSSKDSGIIFVSLLGIDPEKTSKTLTAIGSQYVYQNTERKASEAQKSIDFSEAQLPFLQQQLEKSEAAYNAFRVENRTLNLSEEGAAVLQQSVDVQNRLTDLQQKRDELSARFTPNHPAVASIDSQIESVKMRLGDVEEQTKRLPMIEQKALRLTRDMEVNRDLYTNLLETSQQLRLLRAGKTGNARMVDAAVTAELPVKPNRKMVVALAMLIGLFLGSLAAWMRRELFGGVLHPNEIEQMFGIPVYAVIPESKEQEKLDSQIAARKKGTFVLAATNTDDYAAESFRSLRTAMQFALLDANSNVVLITGATLGVGKSFCAANFAAVVAASGQRVLLVDSDIRKGVLHHNFSCDPIPGLSDAIAGTASVDAVLHKQVLPNLDFVARGSLSPNPSELLVHGNTRKIIESLRAAYDLVIVDSPPVLAVSDSIELGKVAGGIFLVVRQDASKMGEVTEVIKRFAQVGIVPKGAIFNGAKMRPGSYGYGYGRYRYSSYSYAPYKDVA